MTIIKVSKDGKALLKKVPDEIAVALTPDNATEERVLHIQTVSRDRSKRCVNIFLLLLALLVLSGGIIGSIFLFKHISHKHSKHSKVTVQYKAPQSSQQTGFSSMKSGNGGQPFIAPPQSSYLTMEEDIDIEVDEEIERIEVPQFDECMRSLIIHDFFMNITAIVDTDDSECFIMDLDREKMKPPRSFAELIRLYSTGYYMPNVEVVRRQYTVETPALQDLSFAGNTIRKECQNFSSYRLIKRDHEEMPPIARFEVHLKLMKTYGYTDLSRLFKDQIFK